MSISLKSSQRAAFITSPWRKSAGILKDHCCICGAKIKCLKHDCIVVSLEISEDEILLFAQCLNCANVRKISSKNYDEQERKFLALIESEMIWLFVVKSVSAEVFTGKIKKGGAI